MSDGKNENMEKVQGFDPAMSPMPTDAEAGGTPTRPSAAQPSGETKLRPKNESSHGSAMRPFEDAAVQSPRKPVILYAAIIVVLAALLVAGVSMALA